MQHNAQVFDEIVNYRRSVRIYDGNPIPDDVFNRCMDRTLLAPNSSNMQLWEFYRIKSDSIKKQVAYNCLNQNAAKTASEMLVIVTRRDLWKSRALFNYNQIKQTMPDKKSLTGLSTLDYYKKLMPLLYFSEPTGLWSLGKKIMQFFVGLKKPTVHEVTSTDMRIVAHKSAALAAQTFMLSMSAEGYDTCPMEGFDSKRMKKLLNLPSGAEINMVISYGKRKPEGVYGARLRVPKSEVVFEL